MLCVLQARLRNGMILTLNPPLSLVLYPSVLLKCLIMRGTYRRDLLQARLMRWQLVGKNNSGGSCVRLFKKMPLSSESRYTSFRRQINCRFLVQKKYISSFLQTIICFLSSWEAPMKSTVHKPLLLECSTGGVWGISTGTNVTTAAFSVSAAVCCLLQA